MSGIEISNHFLLVRDLDWFATLEYQFHAPGFGHAAHAASLCSAYPLEAIKPRLSEQKACLLVKLSASII